MTERKRPGASRTAETVEQTAETPAPSALNGSEALGSPSRSGGWLLLIVRAAVYITAALVAEVLLSAWFRLTGIDEE